MLIPGGKAVGGAEGVAPAEWSRRLSLVWSPNPFSQESQGAVGIE